MILDPLRLRSLGVQSLLSRLQLRQPMRAVPQLRRGSRVVPILLRGILGRILPGGLNQHLLQLLLKLTDRLLQPVPVIVLERGGISLQLGAIQRQQPHPQQPGVRAQPQHLHEHRRQHLPMPIPEPGDRGMIRNPIPRQHPIGNIANTTPLNLT